MVFDARLAKEQFIRIAIVRHLQRPIFFLISLFCTGLMAYAIIQEDYRVIWAGVIPLIVYILVGIITALRTGNDPQNPVLSRIEYSVSEAGLGLKMPQMQRQIAWKELLSWRILLGCYILKTTAGKILIIPKRDVPTGYVNTFEATLLKQLGPRRPI